jgi:NAD(P)-dependent dehydrogenase (short-subunit alcohol dehydrogenase family)
MSSRSVSTNPSGPRILEGKLAIVTGGSRGIGAATCANLAAKGANLVINYTSDSSAEKTQQLAERLQQTYNIKCLPVQADLGSENGPAHIIEMTKNNFSHPKSGKFQIDIIVNNAGVASNLAVEECNSDDFAKLYNVNVRGPLFLMKAAMPYLPHDRSGRVVNVSSVSSSLGFERQSVYGGTKAALESMTRSWARELAERATVNAVNPGPVATDMYAGVSEEFQKKMSHWTINAPLTTVRPGVDRKDMVDNAEIAGGRPVSFLLLFVVAVMDSYLGELSKLTDTLFRRHTKKKSPARSPCSARRTARGRLVVSSPLTVASSSATRDVLTGRRGSLTTK